MARGAVKRPAILTEWGLHTDWVVKPLIEAGYEVDGCAIEQVPEYLATGQYNVLILGRYAFRRLTKQEELAAIRKLRDAVLAFTGNGGGVFFAAPGISVIPIDEIFAPLGVRLLKLGIEQQDGTETVDGVRYGYSTQVSGPVAAGVRGVWYPLSLGHATTIFPLQASASDGWQYVLHTAPGSHSVSLLADGYGLPPEGVDGSMYPDRVPIMALRDGMPGRLAVCGIPAGFSLYAPHNFPTAAHLLAAGFASQQSDLRQLVMNTLAWLAEPSMAAGTFGGGKTHPLLLVPQVPRFPDDPPKAWPARQFPAETKPKLGLIGARTAYSTGAGTVAEYVDKAKEAGHDFLVFLEDLAALDAQKLQALKTECRRYTSDTFFAVPGYTFTDCVGTHYFVYGYQVDLPRDEFLADGGTVLTPPVASDGPYGSRVDLMHMYFVCGELQMRCRKGVYLHRMTPKPLNDHRFNDSTAVITWEDGQVIDDMRDQYKVLMNKGLRLNPTILTLLHHPADMDRALASGWHNTIIEPYETMQDIVLRKYMAPELEWWGTIDAEVTESPRYRFDSWQYGNPFQVATSGPEIEAWAVSVSRRDAEWRGTDAEIPPTADWFRVDVATFRLRMKVTSTVGLDHVVLLDGDRLLRRWTCQGAGSFEQEIDLTHHQQMHLLLEAHDVNGGTAQTSDFLTYRRDWCEFYCADRNNPLTCGFEKDEQGFAYGWSGTEHLTYDNGNWGGCSPWVGRWWYNGDDIYPAPKNPLHDLTLPVDGGVGECAAGIHLQVRMPSLEPPELGLMVNPIQEMISTDAAICSFIVDTGYDLSQPYFHDAPQTGFGLFGGYPTRYLHLRRRAIVFRPKPHALTTTVFQHDLRWKRDLLLTAPLVVGWLDTAPEHVLHRADGTPVCLSEGAGCNMRWHHGEALVSWTDGARPVIFINDGADLLLVREPADETITLQLPVDALPTTDRATTIRLIGIGGTPRHRDPAILDQVCVAMGLVGDPAYRIDMEHGYVVAQRLFLELAGKGGGVAFTLPQVDLPMALPIIVRNLNENWSTVLLDRDARRWRPVGILEGSAYATLDTDMCTWRVFIGHPFTADHCDIVISATQIADQQWTIEIHNPTDATIESTISRSAYFDLIDWLGETMVLPAGQSRYISAGAC
ncbi:MAG: hypothetical protein ACYDBB_09060 [Armatimonadota bacterium]